MMENLSLEGENIIKAIRYLSRLKKTWLHYN